MMKPMNSTTACASSIGPFSHAQLIGMIYDTGMIATRYTIPIIVMIFILDDIDDHSYLISMSSKRFFMIAICGMDMNVSLGVVPVVTAAKLTPAFLAAPASTGLSPT